MDFISLLSFGAISTIYTSNPSTCSGRVTWYWYIWYFYTYSLYFELFSCLNIFFSHWNTLEFCEIVQHLTVFELYLLTCTKRSCSSFKPNFRLSTVTEWFQLFAFLNWSCTVFKFVKVLGFILCPAAFPWWWNVAVCDCVGFWGVCF